MTERDKLIDAARDFLDAVGTDDTATIMADFAVKCIEAERREIAGRLRNFDDYCIGTFRGGYHDERDYQIFAHGMKTVLNHLDAYIAELEEDSK